MSRNFSDKRPLSESELCEFLALRAPDLPLFFYEQTDSTNTRARYLLQSSTPAPFCVVARSQTAGRGRFDRKWFDSSDKSVCLTLALNAQYPQPVNWTPFAIVCAVKICNSLCELTGADLKIKWPNDIYIDGKKLSGMIAEAYSQNGRLQSIIFGVGLNCELPQEISDELKDSVCCLSSKSKKIFNINEVAAAIAGAVYDAFKAVLKNDTKAVLAEFDKFDFLRDTQIAVNDFSNIRRGIARGIDENGKLQLECADGIFLCSAGEASIVKDFAK